MSDFDLKPLSREAIPGALEKANRYRLLNDPTEAISVCLDILATDPDHEATLIVLLLSLTDQFGQEQYSVCDLKPEDLIGKFEQEYHRLYYTGIIHERRAKATLRKRMRGSTAYQLLREAMEWYEKASSVAPQGDETAIVRWNTCARIIENNPYIEAREEETESAFLE